MTLLQKKCRRPKLELEYKKENERAKRLLDFLEWKIVGGKNWKQKNINDIITKNVQGPSRARILERK